jgi:hypothetical protein
MNPIQATICCLALFSVCGLLRAEAGEASTDPGHNDVSTHDSGIPPNARSDSTIAEQSGAASVTGHRTAPHAPDSERDCFHVTALRLWAYRDFLPNSNDSDVLGIELNSAWGMAGFDVMNISYVEVAEYPRAVPGMPPGNPEPGLEGATGITDLLSAFLFSKQRQHHGYHHFAYGFAGQFPTASDEALGSGKWAFGPAVEYEYHRSRFYAAFVALQLWSVAGDADRKEVSMLMIKPMVTYDLGKRWKAVYMPYGITAYWNKPASDAVYLPLGGGIQRGFRIGSQEMAVSVQFFKYALRPSNGSEYDLRFLLEFDF